MGRRGEVGGVYPSYIIFERKYLLAVHGTRVLSCRSSLFFSAGLGWVDGWMEGGKAGPRARARVGNRYGVRRTCGSPGLFSAQSSAGGPEYPANSEWGLKKQSIASISQSRRKQRVAPDWPRCGPTRSNTIGANPRRAQTDCGVPHRPAHPSRRCPSRVREPCAPWRP